MLSKLLSFALILFISLSFSQTDKGLKGIEKQFNSVLESTKAPGFAVAIVKGDKVVYAKGFGYADFENKIEYLLYKVYIIIHNKLHISISQIIKNKLNIR